MVNLFVYGIFLSEYNRKDYGMTNPRYATVKDYATFGGSIVQAVHLPGVGLSLTGLLVDLPDDYNWGPLDSLEYGYERKIVNLIGGGSAYMYVAPERNHNNGDNEIGQETSNTQSRQTAQG